MGCDIHFYVEFRPRADALGLPGAWQSADAWAKDGIDYDRIFHSERNYDLFAILAGVRNGRGFAGVKTGGGFNPISEPRGVPHDATRQVVAEVERRGRDGHSHSWLTVAELMAYDWTQVAKHQGIVGLRDLARWKLSGSPETWSGGVGGAGVKIFPAPVGVDAVDRAIQEARPDGTKDLPSWWDLFHTPRGMSFYPDDAALSPKVKHVVESVRSSLGCRHPWFEVHWETPYYVSASQFLSMTMPRLWRLGRPEDVRVVFFFDN